MIDNWTPTFELKWFKTKIPISENLEKIEYRLYQKFVTHDRKQSEWRMIEFDETTKE